MGRGTIGSVILLGCAWGVLAAPALGQTSSPVDEKLAARIASETEARKACKVEICKVFAEKKGEGAITCEITKTWLQDEIQQRILGNRMTWPWGHAQCVSKIDVDRADLAKLVTSAEATVKLKPHRVACSLDRKAPETGEAYAVKLSIAPEVTFKGAKAEKVAAGWSDIEAPMLAKGPIWAATATDNNFSVLSGSMVAEINTFMFAHCEDVGIKIVEPK